MANLIERLARVNIIFNPTNSAATILAKARQPTSEAKSTVN